MTSRLRRLMRDTLAATSVEYAVLAGGIAVAIVAAVQIIGGSTNGSFQSLAAGF